MQHFLGCPEWLGQGVLVNCWAVFITHGSMLQFVAVEFPYPIITKLALIYNAVSMVDDRWCLFSVVQKKRALVSLLNRVSIVNSLKSAMRYSSCKTCSTASSFLL